MEGRNNACIQKEKMAWSTFWQKKKIQRSSKLINQDFAIFVTHLNYRANKVNIFF